MRTLRPSWNGWCRWTQRLPARTSTPRAHARPAQGALPNHKILRPEPDDHALGRSRGGWSTKTHLSVDHRGRPLSVRLTPGQAGDNPQLLPLLDDIAVAARGAAGRPRRRPDCVIADKAYSHNSTRLALRRRGIRVVIPEKSDQISYRKAKGRGGGRPPSFDAELYRDRNVVERAFNRLKGWRGIATRYDKHARNYRAGLVIACIALFWSR
jgi:transposase